LQELIRQGKLQIFRAMSQTIAGKQNYGLVVHPGFLSTHEKCRQGWRLIHKKQRPVRRLGGNGAANWQPAANLKHNASIVLFGVVIGQFIIQESVAASGFSEAAMDGGNPNF
jgi:hypothetical protein